ASQAAASRWCLSCCRPDTSPCRSRAICPASGAAPMRRCAARCADAIRAIPGRTIRYPRHRRAAPSRAGLDTHAPMKPLLIGLDWGTTSCRAYLIGAGGIVLERVTDGPGILKVENGAFGAALDAMIGRWDSKL